jgi:hypothetical protein
LQQAIGGGWTDRQQLFAHGISEGEMPVAFERRYQLGQKGYQTPRADTVGGTPGDLERLLHRKAILWSARATNLRRRGQGRARQKQDGIFTRVARGCHKFIENNRLLRVRGLLIAGRDLRKQLALGTKAHA